MDSFVKDAHLVSPLMTKSEAIVDDHLIVLFCLRRTHVLRERQRLHPCLPLIFSCLSLCALGPMGSIPSFDLDHLVDISIFFE
jgi:hypothetical protein